MGKYLNNRFYIMHYPPCSVFIFSLSSVFLRSLFSWGLCIQKLAIYVLPLVSDTIFYNHKWEQSKTIVLCYFSFSTVKNMFLNWIITTISWIYCSLNTTNLIFSCFGLSYIFTILNIYNWFIACTLSYIMILYGFWSLDVLIHPVLCVCTTSS
jgi:hypothetical protein